MLIEHELFDILRGFASLGPPKSFNWPHNIPTAKVHDFLLNSILTNPHFTSYPPSVQYQKDFWKWAIENMELGSQSEASDFEIDERIYERYLGLLPSSGLVIGSSNPENRGQVCGRGLPVHHHPPSESYVTHYWLSTSQNPGRPISDGTHNMVNLSQYQRITLLESRRMIEGGTTGLRTWRASFALAHYLTQHTDAVASKRVLELGSGVGFLGILVAALQTQPSAASSTEKHLGSLYLTDLNHDVLTRCQDNIHLECNLSSTHPDIHVQALDWSTSLDDDQRNVLISLLENKIKPDVVLGADIVFDPSLIPALVGVLVLILSGTSCHLRRYALVALTVRNPTTVDAFVTGVEATGLQITQVPVNTDQSAFPEFLEVSPGQENVYLFRVVAQC